MASQFKLTMPVWHGTETAFSNAFGTFGVPSSALVNANGKVVKTYFGPIDFESTEFQELIQREIEAVSSLDAPESPGGRGARTLFDVGGVSIILAFTAGLLSVASPCVLPLVPVYLGYLTGVSLEAPVPSSPTGDIDEATDRAASRTMPSPFLHSLAFVSGFTAVFVILGASVGLIGWVLRDNLDLILRVAGVVLVIMGLHQSRVITIPFLDMERRLEVGHGTRVGYVRSFIVGAAFSAGWSPCVGPTLGSIFALAVSSNTVVSASILLVVYSAGLCIPFLLMGVAYSRMQPVYRLMKRHARTISYISGAFLIFVGVLVFTDSVTRLNEYFDFGLPGTSV